MNTLPAFGVHHGVPESVYRAWDAINQSRLKDNRTPAHLLACLEATDKEPTEDMLLGTAQHLAILDPGQYARRVVYEPFENRRGKEYAKWREETLAEKPDAVILRPEDRAVVTAMSHAVRQHAAAAKLIDAAGDCELACLWRDADTGLACKGRFDRLPRDEAYPIVELKTTSSAAADDFGRTAFRMGYDIQAAFYVDGLSAATGLPSRPWVWIVVENVPPYGVAVYGDPNGNWLALGRTRYRQALATIAKCRQSGEWPGYVGLIQELPVPGYVARDFGIDTVYGDALQFAGH